MKTDQVIGHIVNWLGSYCSKAGLKGFVIGVSGGIDSAVTSTLCAKTAKPVWALNMPILQNPDQLSLAEKHIEWLGKKYPNVNSATVDLSDLFAAFKKSMPKSVFDNLAQANTRSRIRMTTLYAFATHHKMLVVGTGNKVEDFGVGFYTKYGDGGVDLSPIADLFKTEVYELGKNLGIIESIMEAAPTDGLWADNRTDESQIGATYEELEWAMSFEIKTGDKDILNPREKEVLEIYRKFNYVNKHKMEPIPVCMIPLDFK
ncbi:MAG TPA: NAD(+) synthase [Desulfobacteraceae bacterium]|nr:NAD(+) synthase [Desulfobacteraceae bacterium]